MDGFVSRRIVIVDRHRLYADSVQVALSLQGHDCHVRVTQGVATQAQALADVCSVEAVVALMDLDLSHAWDGVDLIAPVVARGTNVVVVTDSTDPGRRREALGHGASGVLPKSSSVDTLCDVVRQVTPGDRVPPDPALPAAPGGTRSREEAERAALRQRLQRLTGRENEVLAQLMSGHTVSEIARASVVSEATVRTQVRSILTKLEVSSQLAAVGIAHRLRWAPVADETRPYGARGSG